MKPSHLLTSALLSVSTAVSGQSVVLKPQQNTSATERNGNISVKSGVLDHIWWSETSKSKKWEITVASEVDQVLRDTFWPDAKREWGAVTFQIAVDQGEGEMKWYIGKYKTQNIPGYNPAPSSFGIHYIKKFK